MMFNYFFVISACKTDIFKLPMKILSVQKNTIDFADLTFPAKNTKEITEAIKKHSSREHQEALLDALSVMNNGSTFERSLNTPKTLGANRQYVLKYGISLFQTYQDKVFIKVNKFTVTITAQTANAIIPYIRRGLIHYPDQRSISLVLRDITSDEYAKVEKIMDGYKEEAIQMARQMERVYSSN